MPPAPALRTPAATAAVVVAVLVATAVSLWRPPPARANGAFPDSGQLMLVPGSPLQIAIGTNFGILSTEDGGATWSWVCEGPLTQYGAFYQVGDRGRILAISTSGLVYSDDGACSWSRSAGALTAAPGRDYFIDRSDPQRVLALASQPDGLMTMHVSTDGGATFGDALLAGAADEVFTGVESSRSDPRVVYAVSYGVPMFGGRLARSGDGGATWTFRELPAEAMGGTPRIVLVDPEDPDRLLLRVSPAFTGDRLVLTEDGGATYRSVLEIGGRLAAFLSRSDGVWLTAGETDGAGVGFDSVDRGRTFRPWPISIHVRALAERDGALYAATNQFADGHALAVSLDGGATFEPRFGYAEVATVKACASTTCREICSYNAALGLWPATVCGPVAGGDGGDGDGRDQPGGGGRDQPGCACGLAARNRDPYGTPAPGDLLLLLSLAAATGGVIRRRPTSRCTGPRSARCCRSGSR